MWVTNSTLYLRISFYNAKTGKVSVFYNFDNSNYTSPEKMYFKVDFSHENGIYNIDTNSNTGNNPNIAAYELGYNSNKLYLNKYNKTFDNYNNLQQNYPTGNTFNYETATYTTEL